jgi:hypothetical protein
MPACPVCETSKKAAFLCQGCINAQLFDEEKRDLRQKRDELLQRLQAALPKRVRPRRGGGALRSRAAACTRGLGQARIWDRQTGAWLRPHSL